MFRIAQRIAQQACDEPIRARTECACEEEQGVVAGEAHVWLEVGRYAGGGRHGEVW
jgi:hypothetical protein